MRQNHTEYRGFSADNQAAQSMCCDDHVRLEIELPWLPANVAQQIQQVVNA
jgi:hypothetical protein